MRKPILLTALLVFIGISAMMAQPVPKISKSDVPKWLKPISVKPQQINLDDISLGYYYELLEEQVHLGEQTHYHNTTTVVSDEAGAENAGHLEVEFDPSYQKVFIHRVEIEREGKIQNRLDLSKFKVIATENDLKRFIYNGSYSAFTILDDIRKGDKIRFSYSLVGFNPVFEGKYFESCYLEGGEPSGLVHIVYVVPEGRILNIRKQNGAISEKKINKNGLNYYYWERPSQLTDGYVDYVPYWFNQNPRVEVSEFSTWRQVAEWAKRVNPIHKLKPGTELHSFVQKLWAESNEDQELFFEKSLDFVQNSVRYMGVEMGENSHRAHNPEIVFKQRYGDCKDKSLLLASMLADKGIESSLVLANTYQDKELDKVQPSPAAFNHMVLSVFINSQMKAVDPTISNQGGPVMERYFPPYGQVLSINSGTHLDELEKSTKDGFLVRFEDVFQLLGGDKANLKVFTTYRYNEADKMRSYLKENARNQIQNDFEDYYKGIYEKAKRLKPIVVEDNLEKNVLTIAEEYLLESYLFKEDGQKQKYAPAFSKPIYERLPKVSEDRMLPIALSFPIDIEHVIKIVNKDNIPAGSLNFDDFVEEDAYFFSRSIKTNKDTVLIKNVFITNDSFIPMEKSSKYLEDFKKIENNVTYILFASDDGKINLGDVTNFKFNIWVTLVFLFVAGLTVWFIWAKYNRSKPTGFINLEHAYEETSIGGWLILVLIGSVISIAQTILMSFSADSPLNANQWELAKAYNIDNGPLYYIFLAIILVFNAIGLVFTIYTAILLFKRRDIFPQTFVFLRIGLFIMYIVMFIFIYLLNPSEFTLGNELGRSIWEMLFMILWCFYMIFSKRVKRTFTVPYKAETYPNESDEIEGDLAPNNDPKY